MFCSFEDDASVAKSRVRMSVVGEMSREAGWSKSHLGGGVGRLVEAGSGSTTAALATLRLRSWKLFEARGESFAQGCRLHRGQGLMARSRSNVPDLEDMAFSKVRQ